MEEGSKRELLTIVGLIIGAFVLYSAWWGLTPRVVIDTIDYQTAAADLRDGSLDAIHDRTPGYPLLLTATASTETPTAALWTLQFALHGASVVVAALIARSMGVTRRGRLLLVLALLSPPLVEPAATALSESTASFWVVMALGAFAWWTTAARTWLLVAAGAASMMAAFTRPSLLFVPIVIAVAAAASTQAATTRLRTGVLVIALPLVAIGSFVAWNGLRFGEPTMTPRTGWHLSTKTASFVEDLPDSYEPIRGVLVSGRDAALLRPGSSHTAAVYIWATRDDVLAATDMDEAEVNRYMVRLNLELIARNPLRYTSEVQRSLATYLGPSAEERYASGVVGQAFWSIAHYLALAAFIAQLAAVGSLTWARTRLSAIPRVLSVSAWYWAGIGVVIGNAIVSSAFEAAIPRHRATTETVALLLLAVGWSRLAALRDPDATASLPVT